MFSTENTRALRLILLFLAIYICVIAGPRVQIGDSITRLSLVDISVLAIGEPSFAAAFSKIAELANFSVIDRVLELVALVTLFFSVTLLRAKWLNDHSPVGDRGQDHNRRGMTTAAQVMLLGLVVLFSAGVFETKAGFDYSELAQKAGLSQKAPIDGPFQIRAPKLGEKPEF